MAKAAIVLLTSAALLQITAAAAAIGTVWVLISWGSYSETAIGFPTAAALLHYSAAAASCCMINIYSWGSYSETAIGIPTAAALLHFSAAAASCHPPLLLSSVIICSFLINSFEVSRPNSVARLSEWIFLLILLLLAALNANPASANFFTGCTMSLSQACGVLSTSVFLQKAALVAS